RRQWRWAVGGTRLPAALPGRRRGGRSACGTSELKCDAGVHHIHLLLEGGCVPAELRAEVIDVEYHSVGDEVVEDAVDAQVLLGQRGQSRAGLPVERNELRHARAAGEHDRSEHQRELAVEPAEASQGAVAI